MNEPRFEIGSKVRWKNSSGQRGMVSGGSYHPGIVTVNCHTIFTEYSCVVLFTHDKDGTPLTPFALLIGESDLEPEPPVESWVDCPGVHRYQTPSGWYDISEYAVTQRKVTE